MKHGGGVKFHPNASTVLTGDEEPELSLEDGIDIRSSSSLSSLQFTTGSENHSNLLCAAQVLITAHDSCQPTIR